MQLKKNEYFTIMTLKTNFSSWPHASFGTSSGRPWRVSPTSLGTIGLYTDGAIKYTTYTNKGHLTAHLNM
jgi:hypothetical protein